MLFMIYFDLSQNAQTTQKTAIILSAASPLSLWQFPSP